MSARKHHSKGNSMRIAKVASYALVTAAMIVIPVLGTTGASSASANGVTVSDTPWGPGAVSTSPTDTPWGPGAVSA
jgi:hypothetical protein